MGKWTIPLVSFLSGILVAALYFNLQSDRVPELDDGRSTADVSRESSSGSENDTESPGTLASQEIAGPGQAATPDPAAPENAVVDTSLNARDARPAAGESTEIERQNAGVSTSTTQNDARDPIPVVEEIAPFFEKYPDASSFHDELERQDRDASWSAYMEAQIADYLASKPALSAHHIALVECRSSMCEVHAVGYGPDAATVWFSSISDMPQQPWAAEFGGGDGTFQMDEFSPGITSILVQMARSKSDSSVNAVEAVASRK